MQMQLDAVPSQRGFPMGSDCLCPPVCFQYPPPFCLPCGPGPSNAPDGAGDCMPPPRQCGPFLMLNTPMERKVVMLPMRDQQRPHERQGQREGHAHRHDADCCDDVHHHHHGDPEVQECCEEAHHHHHHHSEDQGICKLRKRENGGQRERYAKRDDSGSSASRRSSRGRERGRARDARDYDDDEASLPKQAKQNYAKDRETRRDKKRATVRSARTNSRELRAGKLYIGCDCEKRNGLQDDCQRSLCQGSPECTTTPPTCAPSAFSNGKHLSARREAFEKKLREAFKNC